MYYQIIGIIRDNKTWDINIHVRMLILNDLLWEYYQIESNNIYDVTNVKFKHVRMSNENLFIVNIILINFRFDVPFRKT